MGYQQQVWAVMVQVRQRRRGRSIRRSLWRLYAVASTRRNAVTRGLDMETWVIPIGTLPSAESLKQLILGVSELWLHARGITITKGASGVKTKDG